MTIPFASRQVAAKLAGALLSLLLFVGSLLYSPLREEVARRVGFLLDQLLGSSSSPDSGAGVPVEKAHAKTIAAPVRQRAATVPTPQARARVAARLLIEGTWVPSGWMGDAEDPDGPLKHRFTQDRPGGLSCEEWSYQPAQGRQGWVAVSYQFPDINWGQNKGKDLSRHGFTRLTFHVRGKEGGRVLFKSGGHTRPGAPFPASYEVSSGLVTLTRQWQRCTLPLPPGTDLSNTTTAFAFVLNRHWGGSVVFCLRDIAFEGPQE